MTGFSLIEILIVIALNVFPADVESFTIRHPGENDAIRLTRQADGGWRMLPDEIGAVFHVEGGNLTVKAGEREHTRDFAELLGIPEGADWSTLESVEIGGGAAAIRIEHVRDGFDLVLSPAGAGAAEQAIRFSVRRQAAPRAVPPEATPDAAAEPVPGEVGAALRDFRQALIDLPAGQSALRPDVAANILRPIIDRPSDSVPFLTERLSSDAIDERGLAVLALSGFVLHGQLPDPQLRETLRSVIDHTDWTKADPRLRLPTQIAHFRGLLN